MSLLLDETDDKYIQEYDAAEIYNDTFINLNVRADIFLEPRVVLTKDGSLTNSSLTANEHVIDKNSTYKLPKLELRKFDGDLKNWLSFWGQFSKIHLDNNIGNDDKFQYLIQSVVTNSKAGKIVNSYPPTSANYSKVIEQLKDRFGRTDLLVQVYVRELIAMIMENAIKGKVWNDLGSLYDNLGTHLRGLESLGCTQDKFADFLCPLVESCLPKEVLRLWQREVSHRENLENLDGSASALEKLMDFLRREVHSEERVTLAHSKLGVSEHSGSKQKVFGGFTRDTNRMETAATLINSQQVRIDNIPTRHMSKEEKFGCIFCTKNHDSNSCFDARNKPLEERKRIVLNNKACFLCLKCGHCAKNCRTVDRCINCGRRHAVILCPDLITKNKSESPNESRKTGVSAALYNKSHTRVLLGTLLTKVESDSGDHVIRCLIDTGAERSYISQNVARKYNLEVIRQETMIHGLFGGAETEAQKHDVHRVYLCSKDNAFRCNFEVLTQPKICGTVGALNSKEVKYITNKYGVPLSEDSLGPLEVELLIGADVAAKLFTGDIKSVGADLVAVGTKLGWIVMGKLDRPAETKNYSTLTTLSLYAKNAAIAKLWQMDLIGITDPLETRAEDVRQIEILQQFVDSIKVKEDGRYQVRLPWKTLHQPLPDNKVVALQRLHSTMRKLEEKSLVQDYQKVFQEWIESGFIEKVSSADTSSGHYLPHRPIIKEGSTTRIRPVFDASAHQKGSPSLNDCLEKGMNLIEEIPTILERFREHKIGVISDIEKAFLQLEVDPKQRDFLRFFGVDAQEYRHKRVVFGVSSSPFLLSAVLRYHFSRMLQEFGDIVHKLEKSFYVDNCVSSVANVEELLRFVNVSTEVMRRGCFNLRGWESNYLGPPTCNSEDREVSVLGLVWNLKRDTLRCKAPIIAYNLITKRVILSSAQRIFDPIGVLCPVVLYPKILLQELWSIKIDWDDRVPQEYHDKFLSWANQVSILEKIELPRYTYRRQNSQLHVFTDASQKAYAASVFLRTSDEEGVTIRLLRAKSRVAPVERVTIPRLELLACVIGVRLAKSIRVALNDEDIPTTYWSDSTNALWWITKEGSWTTFVQNRITEIRRITEPEQWRYIPGEQNPADLPSRGCSAQKLFEGRWWEGPIWLSLPECNWPTRTSFTNPEDVELMKTERSCLLLSDLDVEKEDLDYLKYFSSYHKIVRMMAWAKRFIHNARRGNIKRVDILSSEEIGETEKTLFRKVQESSVHGHRRASLAKVFQDREGLLRLETKITEREDVHSFLYPIVLPGDHPLILKLITDEHVRACHAGPQLLFGVLREKYWIIGAKKAVRKVIYACVRCKRYLKKPICPEPVALPKDRVKESAAFEVTGVDLAGPLYVHEGKVWIVIFTCAVCRAVHLELVSSLSTTTFLQALRRFIARRGRPSVIYSDNGTNFHGANNAFKSLDWNKISTEGDVGRILWKFNPPSAAWWGGWWERIVRIVKDLLRKTLHRARVNFEELTTILCDCESVINSRPLTYCSGETDELTPLTPSLFLRDMKSGVVEDIDLVDSRTLQRRVRNRNRLVQQLRERFRREYLGQLVEESVRVYGELSVKVGEIVLVGDDKQKRLKWPIGMVEQVYPGKDGIVRCASVRTASGVVLRPVQRLYRLEMSATTGAETSNFPRRMEPTVESSTSSSTEIITRRGRPVKRPARLDLFNMEKISLSINSKVGGCCEETIENRL